MGKRLFGSPGPGVTISLEGLVRMKLEAHIYRLDPLAHTAPHYQTFEMDLDPRETVSGMLHHIYENMDPSLAFRFTCNMQKCGECAIMVNGLPCLACERTVEAEMNIDPLPNLPIIKDLVIDRHRVIRDILEKGPTVLCRGQTAYSAISPGQIRLGSCLECLCCQATCEVLKSYPDQFIGPLGLLWFAQGLADSKAVDQWSEQIRKTLAMCDFCGACLKACPDTKKPLAQAFSGLARFRRQNK
jgi:succinate dehydrogenase/fumarate reductase iron-sulfur protein